MLVEIKGVQFVNKGASLMLQAIVDRLQQSLPGVEFAIAPGPNAPYRQVAAAGAWQRLRLPGAPIDVDALSYRLPERLRGVGRRHGVVTESDIDAVLDASGFAYAATWGDAPLSATAREIDRLHARSRPYVFLPQAFGPFADSPATRTFGRALRTAALVCARDGQSRTHVESIAGTLGDRLEVSPDFTLALPGDPDAAARWGVDRGTALLVPNRHMVDAHNPDASWRSGYLPLLVSIARRLATLGYTPRVLNHEGAGDTELCNALREATGTAEVIADDDPRAIKGLVGAAGLVVSSRFHGCANALSQGVPCLGTGWSHKYAALFNEFGVGDDILADCDEAQALHAVERLACAREAVGARLAAARPALEARIEAMWSRVLPILGAAGKR